MSRLPASRYNTFLVLLVLTLIFSACQPIAVPTAELAGAPDTTAAPTGRGPGMGPGMMGQGRGRMMGAEGGMMTRHHAPVPEDYAELSNPVELDAASLDRGQAIYTTYCASCHGDTGMGEGVAGQALDPAPAPVAHTSQMLSDGYLFWRISEGGAHFETAMPVWQEVLDEQARWDVINYVRSLGDGSMPMMGGRGPGPGAGAGVGTIEDHTEMLADGVAQGVITEAEAELFEHVHAVLDEQLGTNRMPMQGMGMRGMQTMQRAFTEAAVRAGLLSQAEADDFTDIHDRLIEAGLMQ